MPWFQIVAGAFITGLTGLAAWTQLQIGWVRRDNELTESRAVLAVQALRDEFNSRQSVHERVQDRQHLDNQAEQSATRATVAANAAAAAADMRRVLDSLERIGSRLAEIPDRDEVMKLIATTRRT